MLEFLNPWMLAGAAAAAVPVVLHLIMRQTPKHVVFPALRFIVQRKDSNRRKLRFRHLLLLALRVAALCFLALALARPSLTSSDLLISAEDPVSAAMVFNTAPSMAYEHGNQTRVQQAQDIALWVLNELPKDSQVAVLDSATRQASFQVDLEAARKRIEKLETTVVPDRYLNLVGEALRLLADKAEHEAKEIYLFTDLTKGGWTAADAAGLDAALAALPGVSIHVIDVGIPSPQNTALFGLELSREVAAENSRLLLKVNVRRIGAEVSTPVEMRIAGRTGIVAQETVTLNDGESQALEFALPDDLPAGVHQGEVRIASGERNLLETDDRLYFTLRLKNPWRVLLVSADVEQAQYLERALAPSDFVAERRATFSVVDVVAPEKLGDQNLSEYAAVCLVDPPRLPPESWDQLADYVRGGGNVAVFLGKGAATANASESFNVESAQALLPGELLLYNSLGAGANDASVFLDPAGYEHRLLAPLAEIKDYLLWNRFPIRRYWVVQPNGTAEVVMRYTNRQPALFLRAVGEGAVLVLTTPLADRAANNLLTGLDPAPGVMLVNSMVYYLVGGTRPPLNYVAAPNLVVDVPLPQRPQGVVKALLHPPAGEATWLSSLPNQARIPVTVDEGVGGYRLEQKDIGLDEGFSVNLRPEDTDLTRAADDDLKAAFGAAPYTVARSQSEVERLVRVSRKGQELFPYLIALVAIILGVEHVLANRFYRHESASGPEEKPSALAGFNRAGERVREPAGA